MAGQLSISGSVADGSITESKLADDAVTADKLANSINTAIAANTAKDLTALSASNLTSGTVPDARFPATLPAVSGANLTNLPPNRVNRNLIINGAMQVAQRGTSSTSGGYQTVDRMPVYHTGGAVTQSQESLTSGSPFEKGFTKYLRLTNTTANTGTDVARSLIYKIEAQDIANSGWNYKSSSSYITISFWVRSSVSQQFYIMARTQDGTSQAYPFSLGTLSADTWTKVTHSISGNSNLQFDNNNDRGLEFFLYVSLGTDFTSSSVTLNAWGAYTSSARLPDYTNSWAAATNATFDITGMQLEVGSVATDFEHRSFAQEIQLCKRYYEVLNPKLYILARYSHHDGAPYGQYHFAVEKRVAPTCSFDTTGGTFESSSGYSGNPSFTDTTVDATTIYGANSVTAGGILYLHTSSGGLLKFNAEL